MIFCLYRPQFYFSYNVSTVPECKRLETVKSRDTLFQCALFSFYQTIIMDVPTYHLTHSGSSFELNSGVNIGSALSWGRVTYLACAAGAKRGGGGGREKGKGNPQSPSPFPLPPYPLPLPLSTPATQATHTIFIVLPLCWPKRYSLLICRFRTLYPFWEL